MFKADSIGVAYVVETVHPVLGEIESCPSRDNDEIGAREWGIKRFERAGYPERYVRIVGDCSGPQAQSLDVVLEIVDRCDEVERLVVEYIKGDPKAFPFASNDFEIDCFELLFFDRGDSAHYSAHLTYEIPEGLFTSYGEFTESHGNGVFEVVFDMRGLQIVELCPATETEGRFDKGCVISILQWIAFFLIPFVLVSAVLVFGIIKLVGLFAE